MSFFVTSVGMGDGANLGGLEGVDAHCQQLAEAAGSSDQTWRDYLSTQEEGKRGISARSRIGTGPWHNAIGLIDTEDSLWGSGLLPSFNEKRCRGPAQSG